MLTLQPIGIVHSPIRTKAEAARQPPGTGVQATIELNQGNNFGDALADLPGFELIWVLYWFHLNRNWRPKVLPPRSRKQRRGVFATRSPHRPNPIGLSVVRLDRIEGLTLYVRDVDMLDGSPVLDIKPYLAYADAYPGARSGWLEDSAAARAVPATDPLPSYAVQFDTQAAEQVDWVESATGLPLRARIHATLALGPQPHAYRRIRRIRDRFQLAVQAWRIEFQVDGARLQVRRVRSGYRPRELAVAQDPEDPRAIHRRFAAAWPD